MSYEDAYEFFQFNTLGAWAGEYTPIFIWSYPEEEDGQATELQGGVRSLPLQARRDQEAGACATRPVPRWSRTTARRLSPARTCTTSRRSATAAATARQPRACQSVHRNRGWETQEEDARQRSEVVALRPTDARGGIQSDHAGADRLLRLGDVVVRPQRFDDLLGLRRRLRSQSLNGRTLARMRPILVTDLQPDVAEP